MGPEDERTTGPEHQGTVGPEDQGTRRPEDQKTKRPEGQRSRAPEDQGTRGPGDQRTRGPGDQAIILCCQLSFAFLSFFQYLSPFLILFFSFFVGDLNLQSFQWGLEPPLPCNSCSLWGLKPPLPLPILFFQSTSPSCPILHSSYLSQSGFTNLRHNLSFTQHQCVSSWLLTITKSSYQNSNESNVPTKTRNHSTHSSHNKILSAYALRCFDRTDMCNLYFAHNFCHSTLL